MNSIFAYVLAVVVLLSSLTSGASPSPGSRSILRTITDASDHPDVAVDLNASIFDAFLRDTPATFALVEFFANWCPACRNYKPQYEKVARLFNGPNAAHPGMVIMARVDCALKINIKLCDKYSVTHYPMLFWGTPSKFTVGGWEPGKDNSEIKVVDNGRTAEILLKWINMQMGSSFGLDDERFQNDHLQLNTSDPEQIARAVYDVEETTALAMEFISQHKMIKAGTRAPIIKFLQLLVAHHPSKRCRKGSAEILMNFDELYPSIMLGYRKREKLSDNGKDALENFQICGEKVPRGYWIFCRGSRNDTRGFSCGLWTLMHALSVRIEDEESQVSFTTICDFVHNFFVCEECRQHFYKMCSSVSVPFNKTQDFALWLWSAHNKVNERLKKDEASVGTTDPKFPKMAWPSKQLCPKCHLLASEKTSDINQINWDRDEVFKFIVTYYGKTLVSFYEEKDILSNGGPVPDDTTAATNAVVVPLGAALAIALASCAFGALACYWRARQKSRKTRKNWT